MTALFAENISILKSHNITICFSDFFNKFATDSFMTKDISEHFVFTWIVGNS